MLKEALWKTGQIIDNRVSTEIHLFIYKYYHLKTKKKREKNYLYFIGPLLSAFNILNVLMNPFSKKDHLSLLFSFLHSHSEMKCLWVLWLDTIRTLEV